MKQALKPRTVHEPVNGTGSGGSGRYWRMPSAQDINRIRKKLNLTQQEFAERFGFEVETVRNWEQAKKKPSKSASVLLNAVEKYPETIEEVVSDMSVKR